MIKYITEFLKEFEFDTSDRIDIAIAYEKIADSNTAAEALYTVTHGYEKDNSFITAESYKYVKIMAEAADIHPSSQSL